MYGEMVWMITLSDKEVLSRVCGSVGDGDDVE